MSTYKYRDNTEIVTIHEEMDSLLSSFTTSGLSFKWRLK